jgi:hypothetical protein
MVRAYRRTGAAGDDHAARHREGRRFRWWHDDDGMVCFEGRLPPEDAAIVLAALGAECTRITEQRKTCARATGERSTAMLGKRSGLRGVSIRARCGSRV